MFENTKSNVFVIISDDQYIKNKVFQILFFFLKILNQKLNEFDILKNENVIQIHTINLILSIFFSIIKFATIFDSYVQTIILSKIH